MNDNQQLRDSATALTPAQQSRQRRASINARREQPEATEVS
jgi:hypothetical protein